ncbi:MAG TPA: transposase [Ktedonobacterales bacterium]|nr:transposase [Ktedonobacterales bacterium]
MSTIQRAYKTELDLNNAQVTACKKHAGAARWAYNWGLYRRRETHHQTGTGPSAIELHRELNALKQTSVPWLYEVSKCAPQEALRNLDHAFAAFFRRCTLKQEGRWKGKLGYPQPKTKKRGLGSFRLTGSIVVFADAIQLPGLGRLRLKERGYLPPTGTPGARVLSATVSEQAGHWYVSVLVEQEHGVPEHPEPRPVVGVDLGIKQLATLSDGEQESNPRPLRRRLKKIKRLQRAVARKQSGSKNRTKAVKQLAAQHRRVAHQRTNTLHQLTSRLAKTKSVVVIEDLNISGMLSNHRLAQAIGDVGFYEFRRQLAYKAAWYGCRVVIASRWEPSSRTCSQCGWVDAQLTLADRTFRCQNPHCGLMMDRDLNAAINLARLAGSSSDSHNACGEDSAGRGRKVLVQLSPMKQEPDAFAASVENGRFWRTGRL